MGRIKPLRIKRVTHELMELHGSEFTDNFTQNKEIVNKLVTTHSKKPRNVIAGYVTRIVRKQPQARPHIKSEKDE